MLKASTNNNETKELYENKGLTSDFTKKTTGIIIFDRAQLKVITADVINDIINTQIYDNKGNVVVILIRGFKKLEEFQILIRTLQKQLFLHLKKIDIRHNQINSNFLPFLFQLIKKLPIACKLNIANNLLNDDDAKKVLLKAKEQKIVVLPIGEQLFDACTAEAIQKQSTYLIQDDSRLSSNRHRFSASTLSRLPRPAAIMKDFIESIQQETGYSCGPAAMRCVLKYYRTVKGCKELSFPDEAKLCEEAKTSARTGSEVADMAQWFEEQKNYIVFSGKDGTIDLLQHCTNQGIPVIVNDNSFGGHFRVAVAVESHASGNAGYNRVWLADPAASFVGGQAKLILKQYDYAHEWRDSKSVKGRYLIAIPKSLSSIYETLKPLFPDLTLTATSTYSLSH